MSLSRRQAVLWSVGAAAQAPCLSALAQAKQPAQGVEPADEDGPRAELKAGQDRNEHMLAPVTINEQGPFEFLLDTGANTSCVSHRLAERLALAPGPLTRVHSMVGVRDRPSIMIDRLQVGPRSRRNVRAISLPISGLDIDGVLGVDWLKGQRLELDFKARRIEITRSRKDENEAGRVAVIPARRRHGQLTIVDADLSGERIAAIIDSGAQVTLCNGPLRALVRAAQTRKGQNEPPQYVRLESLMGEAFQGEVLFLPFLRLGGLQLGNVQVVYADAHVFEIWDLTAAPALVIGMDLLRQFNQVALDFGRSAVRFDFTL